MGIPTTEFSNSKISLGKILPYATTTNMSQEVFYLVNEFKITLDIIWSKRYFVPDRIFDRDDMSLFPLDLFYLADLLLRLTRDLICLKYQDLLLNIQVFPRIEFSRVAGN